MRTPTWWKDIKRISTADLRWLTIWVLIYVTFLMLDILIPNFWPTALLKYVGIFLCIIYTNQKYKSDSALQLALLFTFLADTILVWTPWTIAGVYVFCFAQFLHLMRLTKLPHITLAIYAASLSFFFAFAIANGLEPIYAIASVYGLELICNLVMSIRNYIRDRKHFRTRCACYGFICFFLCDFCVAFRYLALEGAIDSTFLPMAAFLVWFFYYPSQVFIANSSTLEPTRRNRFAKK